MIISILVFTAMSASKCLADWTEVVNSVDGKSLYVDFESITQREGYVYYWILSNSPVTDKYGFCSDKTYSQGDCAAFRYKDLAFSPYKEPMGGGEATSITSPEKWRYPFPNSSVNTILRSVCGR